MSAPEEVRLKRKRTEDPPQSLLLTRDLYAGHLPLKRVRYVRKNEASVQFASTSQDGSSNGKTYEQQDEIMASKTGIEVPKEPVNRTFHLKRPRTTNDDGRGSKRVRNDSDHVPTFEEAPFRLPVGATNERSTTTPQNPELHQVRRPGKGSAIGGQGKVLKNDKSKSNADIQALADSMHQFALDELAKIPKPSATTKPRMSPAQSKIRHDRNVASTTPSPVSDHMDIDNSEFVYDTYVLSDSKFEDEHEGDVGLLIIHDDDEEYWQSLLENDEQEEEVDEDDENAEDYYAADYPEDELASDDEYDNNAYNFRRRANSDVEQWNHRDSDDDEQEADPYSMQSSVVKHWEQELGFTSLRAQDRKAT
ncbi:hypothetical protein AMS68_006356 [Peltaster fructicola]|uniref:Transcription factor Iwr1 domain-containing protein n=1 Tax=Peltaster fructicola TaxID=286661 RepID=A0A6H0Y1U4_9PEZI|nr:hypothetical protein AMS68_006356 [Peltaster fructicola]